MATVILQLDSNIGYTADQITNRITLSDLRDYIEEAIDLYGAEAEVVTQDQDNITGAAFGRIRVSSHTSVDELFTREIGLDDECDICGGYIGDNKSDAADNGYDIGHDDECPNR